jgi:hypothetical protein
VNVAFQSRGTNIRYGAAVYGSFPGGLGGRGRLRGGPRRAGHDDDRVRLRARLLARTLVVGGHRRANLGRRGVPAARRSRRRPSRVAAGRGGRRSHGLPRPRLGRRVVAGNGRGARARCGRPPDHRVGAGRRPSRRMVMDARRPVRRGRRERSASCYCFSRSWFTERLPSFQPRCSIVRRARRFGPPEGRRFLSPVPKGRGQRAGTLLLLAS